MRGGLGIRAACEAVLTAECILSWKNVLPGIIFQLENHPGSEKCSLRDDFPQQKSSCFKGILSQGCFSTAEIILIQRNPRSGMLFNGRNHPDPEEFSFRDDFQPRNASCFRGILSQGLFSTAEIILFQRNPRSGMIFHNRNHPDTEKFSAKDYFQPRNAS